MEGNSVLIRHARIVEPRRVTVGDLLIEDGRIAAIGPNLSAFAKPALRAYSAEATASAAKAGSATQAGGADATTDKSAPARCATIDADGLWALPGFIDLHCHGGRLFDATLGKYIVETDSFDGSDAAFESSMPGFLEMVARHGVTTMLIATFAAETEQIKHSLARLARYLRREPRAGNGKSETRNSKFETNATLRSTSPKPDIQNPSVPSLPAGASAKAGASSVVETPFRSPSVLGFFIEGTFIKRPEYAGAQNATYFCAPSRELFDEMNATAQGMIRYINIVPEHGEAGLDLMRYVTKKGVLVGAGHTECAAHEFVRAIDYGLKTSIHFTNGPTGGSYKPFGGGGAIEAILSSNRITAELICDGYHVNPAYVLDTIKRKGYERIVLVTDGMFPTEAGAVSGKTGTVHNGNEPGDSPRFSISDFTLAGIKGRVSENGRYLQVSGKANTLYGSVLTMDVAFANVVSWLTASLPGIWNKKHKALNLDTAMLRASRMASANAAKLLKINRSTGSIEVGKQADILLGALEGEAGAYRLEVRQTIRGGT